MIQVHTQRYCATLSTLTPAFAQSILSITQYSLLGAMAHVKPQHHRPKPMLPSSTNSMPMLGKQTLQRNQSSKFLCQCSSSYSHVDLPSVQHRWMSCCEACKYAPTLCQ